MSNVSAAEKARQERRLRSSGFLASLGVERTTAFLMGAVAGLIITILTIVTTEKPAPVDVETNASATTGTANGSEEVLVTPR